MQQAERDQYKRQLARMQTALVNRIHHLEDIAIERSPDMLDESQFACDRELAITNLDRETLLLQQVRSALTRLDDGSYGVCLGCNQRITSKRLEAVLWAAYCVRCQEAIDRDHVITAGSTHALLAHVA